MFEWITGPRMTNAIEDLQPDVGYENTIIDAPETPAHQFAVKAFKHALFGTPAPEDLAASRKLQKKQSPPDVKTKMPDFAPPTESSAPVSPSKMPGGILKTPVTGNRARKSVTFGSQVVDNEGKRVGGVSKSGIPNNCPGKFPSPWTPGTELKVDVNSEQKPRTRLTEALLDARTTKTPKSVERPRARDDNDLTLDMDAPRSESGKYWKEQYESYAKQSEREVKKLVAKQQLAKNYARKKDGEVTELITKLEGERKRYRRRELELEQQNKDYQERLRQTMAESASASVEIAALKSRIAILERSIISPSSSDVQESKPSIPIYEDLGKDSNHQTELDLGPDASYLSTKSRTLPAGKENSPPKPRTTRRQTMTDANTRTATPFLPGTKLGADEGQVSTLIAKSPRRRASHSARPTNVPQPSEQASQLPPSAQKAEYSISHSPPRAQPKVMHSSPLPVPSPGPDLWMDDEESAIAPHDKMAFPISMGGGSSYSRPAAGLSKTSRRAAKPRTERQKAVLPTDDLFLTNSTLEPSKPTNSAPAQVEHTKPDIYSPTDSKFDVSKITTHHAAGSALVTKDRVELGPADKTDLDSKSAARRRLAEKKKRKAMKA